jgi:hypothetical protein
LVYWAITVSGSSFQRILLALDLFLLLTQAGDSACSPSQKFDKVKLLTWLIYFSQPLIYIRLSTYPNQLRYGNKLSLDYSNFARHYFRNRWLLSITRLTKMFQFRHLPLTILYIQIDANWHYPARVSPFGNLRFKGCWHLPEAYRSRLRPSSVTYVKAFVICAYVAFYEYLCIFN